MKIFGWNIWPNNPSPYQSQARMEFPLTRINVGGPIIDPKRQQTVSFYDRSMAVPSLGEIYYTERKE